MAKKKKDSNLSIEEKLEQALIPNWDEPYKLPDNWCWTTIGSIANLYRGVSYKKQDGHDEKGVSDCLILRGGNINEGSINTENDTIFVGKQLVSKEQYIRKYDIVIVSSTGSKKVIGRAGISYADYDDVAFGAFLTLVRPIEGVVKPYVSYYFQGDMYRNRMRQLASGVNINNIRNEYITETPIPLPPFEEQKRIVKCIEDLFTKLDEAKEKAQEVVDGFEMRKASILHKAYSGELTQKWREKRGVSIEDWSIRNFEECIDKMQNGLAKRTGTTGIPYVVLRLANLSDDGFITDDLRKIMLDEKEQKSYRLNSGDVVMIRVNGSKDNVAKQIFVAEDNSWAFCDHMIRIKYNEYVLPEYMVLFSKSENYKLYVKDNIVSSAGQNTISRKGMSQLTVPVPSIDEQREITRILLELLSKEHHAVEVAKSVIEQINTIKKAILARAFRGELRTNNSEQESAVELLKQILGEENR